MKLLVLLYAHTGQEGGLRAFEDRALAILSDYATVERYQSPALATDNIGESPTEVHLIDFPDEAAFDAYRNDPRTVALTPLRSKAVRETSVFRLQ